jgi:surface protein
MGILKTITEEYFGETLREEDMIDLTGLDVEIVSFTDNNKKYHRRGYKPKNLKYLRKLLERMIEVRGNKGDFNDIDTSDIKYMSFLFEENGKFNGDISGWDVSKVEDMSCMFRKATSFNQHIGNWNVSSVEDMSHMFEGATSFNQPISNWKVSKVTNILNF